jgi:HK97 family phage major capsid protein
MSTAVWHYLRTGDNGGIKSAMVNEDEAPKGADGWVEIGPGDVSLHPAAAYCLKHGARGNSTDEMIWSMRSLKADTHLQEDAAGEGAELIRADFYGAIVAKRGEASIARAAGASLFPATTKTVNVPYENITLDDAALTAEEAAYSVNQNALFGTKTITVGKYTRMFKISEELEEDEVAGLQSFIVDVVARMTARTENAVIVPKVTTASGLGATFAVAGAADAATIKNVYYSLPSAYRRGSVWCMREQMEGLVRNLQGNPFLFDSTPAATVGDNTLTRNSDLDSLMYKPVFNSAAAEATTTGKKPLLFGNWKYLTIAERVGLQISRASELFKANGQIGIFIRFRFGAEVIQSEAFKHGLMP